MTTSYTIDDHNHRFAAWAASTAARASNKCRFNVETGVAILEASGFNASLSVNDLPPPETLDKKHKEWRKRVIREAKKRGLGFSHGVAAKLINCYLKVRFVCGGHHKHSSVAALHPPIDRLLLNGLSKSDLGGKRTDWRRFRQTGWSTYDSATYEEVIILIRETLGGNTPLWKIEEHWEGHQ